MYGRADGVSEKHVALKVLQRQKGVEMKISVSERADVKQ